MYIGIAPFSKCCNIKSTGRCNVEINVSRESKTLCVWSLGISRGWAPQILYSHRVTMSNVHLTLLSDVTSDYANNEANHFKVKLNPSLKLPESGWKVAIAYAVLPKMAVFKHLQSQSVNLIELWYEAEIPGQSDVWKKDYLSPAELRQWEKAGACHDGVDFFNSL